MGVFICGCYVKVEVDVHVLNLFVRYTTGPRHGRIIFVAGRDDITLSKEDTFSIKILSQTICETITVTFAKKPYPTAICVVSTFQSTVITTFQSTVITTFQSTVITTFQSTVITTFQSTVIMTFQSTVIMTFQYTVIMTFQSTVIMTFQSTVIMTFQSTVYMTFQSTVIMTFQSTVITTFQSTVIATFQSIVIMTFQSTVIMTFHHTKSPSDCQVNKNVTRDHVIQLDKEGKIKRKLTNIPKKDSIMVPDGGYTVVRIKANNPGKN
jgi:hypothetical protein